MRQMRSWKLRLAIVLVTLLGAWIGLAQAPRQVNDAALKTGSVSGEEWISYGVNWAEQRYSPLKQIDATNINRLGLAWSAPMPLAQGNPQVHQENTPLVFNGVLYGITPWSIFPGAAGGSSSYRADPNFVPQPTDIGPTGRGRMNMGTGTGGGGGGRGANVPAAAPELPGAVAVANAQTGTAPAAAPAAPAPPLPVIGPDGPTGSVLYAWDPIARKERWRAPGGGAGPFAGGSLATAGNLVFSSVNNRLLAFRADTGEKIFDLDLGTSQMGPPISFALDGKQYIAVTGGPAGGGGRGGGGGAGAGAGAAVAPRPANLLVLALDGKAPLPWAPDNPQQ